MSRRNPDPWGDFRRDREDISTAAAFFMTFALLALVAWVIFFGTSSILPAAIDALPISSTRTPASYAPTSVASGLTVPDTATGASAAPATAVATATVTPKPAATSKLRIANTGGDGVYLRRTANDADRWIPWPENTVLEYLDEDRQNDGRTYKKVKDPRGNIGWMPEEFLVSEARG